jgi:peptidyl-prolyl cis-trans isomerase D
LVIASDFHTFARFKKSNKYFNSMGVIQLLRNRGGKISVVVISAALLMFLVQDALSGRNSLFRGHGNENSVGIINGDNIEYKDLEVKVNDEVDKYVKRNPTATADDQMKDAFREQVWQQMIQDKVMKPQYEKLGIDVTGQELYTMCTTEEFATDDIRKSFGDPKTKIFNPNAARDFFKRLDEDANGEAHAQWQPFEEYLTTQRFTNKYNSMAKSGTYITALEVKNQFVDGNKKFNFQYVSQQYVNYNDTTIKVTPEEVTAYYNKHKDKYKREEEVRKINYVYFDFIPSADDTAEARAWGNTIATGFQNTKNDSLFVLQNGGMYNGVAKGHGELDAKLEDSLYNSAIGKVVGPYDEAGEVKIAKLVNTKEDTITYYRASHILIKANGPTVKDTLDAMAKATDYMNQIKSGKKTFAEMAMQFGTDGTAQKGGDLGWFKTGAMIKEFEEAVKRTPVGQMTVVKTQFGAHVIKVTAAPSRKKIIVATLSKKIMASQKTIDLAYNTVADLASRSKDFATFSQACKERNVQMRTADLSSTNKYLAGFQNPKTILSWAYRAQKDEVSPLYTIEDKYVIACLKEILPEGFLKQDEITDLQALALKDKKGKVLVEKFNENMKNAQTPEQLAISFGSAAQQIKNATFANTYLEYIGNEPEVLANVVTLPKQKFSKPIQGANGVYVVYVNDILDAPEPDANAIRAQQQSKMAEAAGRVESGVTDALKLKYKVKDLRYRF